MTKDYYWQVFGKTTIEDSERTLLEIDRNDLNWNQKILAKNSLAKQKGYRVLEKSLYRSQKRIEVGADEEYITIMECKIGEILPTDEAKIRVNYKSNISNTVFRLKVNFLKLYSIYL